MLNGIHADAVAEQGAAGTLARGVDADDGQFEGIVLIKAEAADQFVCE